MSDNTTMILPFQNEVETYCGDKKITMGGVKELQNPRCPVCNNGWDRQRPFRDMHRRLDRSFFRGDIDDYWYDRNGRVSAVCEITQFDNNRKPTKESVERHANRYHEPLKRMILHRMARSEGGVALYIVNWGDPTKAVFVYEILGDGSLEQRHTSDLGFSVVEFGRFAWEVRNKTRRER